MRFSPGCNCCYSDPPCSRCSADNDPMAVTFTGFTDARCFCSFLNSTFLVERGCIGVGENDCCWSVSGVETCEYYSSETHYTITATINDIAPTTVRFDVELDLTVYVSGAIWTHTKTIWRLDVASAPPVDCTLTRTLAFNQYQTFPFGTRHACSNHSATTCQLN